MTEQERRLQIVTGEGEVIDAQVVQALRDQIAGLNIEVRAWRTRYANLKRDNEAAARANGLWPVALDLFAYWKQQCHHPNARWTADRFWEAEPFIRNYGEAMCRFAIDGMAYDAYTAKRKNGTVKRFDGWDLIFRSAAKFEEAVNRAPRKKASEPALAKAPTPDTSSSPSVLPFPSGAIQAHQQETPPAQPTNKEVAPA